MNIKTTSTVRITVDIVELFENFTAAVSDISKDCSDVDILGSHAADVHALMVGNGTHIRQMFADGQTALLVPKAMEFLENAEDATIVVHRNGEHLVTITNGDIQF